jgi:predicted porin
MVQKKIIALAFTSLTTTAAFAQSNVTIYGVIDEFLVTASANNKNGDQRFNGLQPGGITGSRLGFKGEEALGDDLKAVFRYEFGTLNPGEGGSAFPGAANISNGITGSIQSFVGLIGGFGTAVGGRLQTLGYDFAVKYNTLGSSVFSPQNVLTFNNGMSIAPSNNGRQNNALAYISPDINGFTAKVNYAFGEQITGTNPPLAGFDHAQTFWALGADYTNGPLSLGLAYHDFNHVGGTSNVAATKDKTQQEWALGASYDFKIVKLLGSYQYLKQENFALAPTGSVKGNLWNIGASIPVGANGIVKLAYSYYSADVSGANKDLKAQNFGIDYEYNLSKRTTAYAGYNYMDNGNHTAFGYPGTSGSVTPSADESAWLLGAGIRLTF